MEPCGAPWSLPNKHPLLHASILCEQMFLRGGFPMQPKAVEFDQAISYVNKIKVGHPCAHGGKGLRAFCPSSCRPASLMPSLHKPAQLIRVI